MKTLEKNSITLETLIKSAAKGSLGTSQNCYRKKQIWKSDEEIEELTEKPTNKKLISTKSTKSNSGNETL